MMNLLRVLLMMVGPFCFWYAMFILVCADWDISNWHWFARSCWVGISLISMMKVFNKYG